MKGDQIFKPKHIIAVIFVGAALFIGYSLTSSILKENSKLSQDLELMERIKEKLYFLKDLQIVYHAEEGKYASNWEELKNFIDNGKFYITERKEKIITLDYGADSSVIYIDTLDIVSVYDSLISRGKYPKLEIDDLSKVPGSELSFDIKAEKLPDYDVFVIVDTNSTTPKLELEEGRVDLKIGSLSKPTTKGNWEK